VHDERTRGPVFDHNTEIESSGRLTPQRSLTSADLCRWCTRRLELRRATLRNNGHMVLGFNYFLCTHCDNSEADMSDWVKPAA
jgi:hypothetical protein